MKFVKEEVNNNREGSHYRRYYFAIGKPEAELIAGFMSKFIRNAPDSIETAKAVAMARNILSTLTKAIKDFDPKDERDLSYRINEPRKKP